MGEQAVVTHANAQASSDPKKENRQEQGFPREKENGSKSPNMKQNHEGGSDPVDPIFLCMLLFEMFEARDDGAIDVPADLL
jgi:hypothetical protein